MLSTVSNRSNAVPANVAEYSLEEIDAVEALCLKIDEALQNEETTFHYIHNYVIRSIPEDIRFLKPFLQILHINHCYELVVLPSSIGELSSLRWLDVSYNGLLSLPPEIGRLRRLERLHVNNNRIDFLPLELWNLKSLNELCVDSNRLRGMPSGVLGMTLLTELHTNNNAFLSKAEVIAAASENGVLSEVESSGTLVPKLPPHGGDCSNCKGRIPKGLSHVTFHNICSNADVPVLHYCCGERCLNLIRQKFNENKAEV
eukprot:PhM_4_TR13236/c0_g1_i1/m.78973